MRARTGIAGLSVSFLIAGLIAVPLALSAGDVARAGDNGTEYLTVDQSAANCSDTAGLTGDVPFCSIQAAANIANPGQTITIKGDAPGAYDEQVTISRSGTASEPITFTGLKYPDISWSGSGATLTLNGAQYVDISGLTVTHGGNSDGIDVIGSSHVTLDDLGTGSLYQSQTQAGTAGINVDGASSNITISRSYLDESDGTALGAGYGTGVEVRPGAQDVTVTTNKFDGRAGTAVDVSGASGVNVTSNSVIGCGTEVTVGGTPAAVLENNAFYFFHYSSFCPASATAVSVAADSTATTKTDYNAFVGTGGIDYSWAGTAYDTPAAFQSATGQGQHDLALISAGVFRNAPPEGSPLIDSADCSAPGELSTDSNGNPHVDDPLVADTGNGTCHADRGADERQDYVNFVYQVSQATGTATAVTNGAVTVTLSHAPATSGNWNEPVTYTVQWGVSGPTATIPANGTATYQFTTPDPETLFITAKDAADTVTYQPTIDVYSTAVPALGVQATSFNPAGTSASPSAAPVPDQESFQVYGNDANAWELSSEAIAFGDGTSQTLNPPAGSELWATHVYPKPGTYTATVTGTDVLGRAAGSASITVTVGDLIQPAVPVRDYAHTVAAHGTVKLSLSALHLIPGTNRAALVTVTVTTANSAGGIIVYPDGASRPADAAVRFGAGQAASNVALATPGGDQEADFYNNSSGPVNLVINTVGHESTSTGTGDTYVPVTPATVLSPTTIAGNHHVAFPVAGTHGVPAGATAVILNIRASSTSAAGHFVTAPEQHPTWQQQGAYWSGKGQADSGLAIVPVAGRVVLTNVGSAAASFTAQVVGYYRSPGTYSSGTGSFFIPSGQARLANVTIGAGQTATIQVAGRYGVPASRATAASVTLAASSATGSGSVTAYARGQARPSVPSLSYARSITATATATTAIPAGAISLYNSGTKPVTVTVDLGGYYYLYPLDVRSQ